MTQCPLFPFVRHCARHTRQSATLTSYEQEATACMTASEPTCLPIASGWAVFAL